MVDLEYIKKNIPSYVLTVGDTLMDNGFQAFLVGGAVRDLLLKREPKDFDIATNALPDQIAKIFPKSVSTNARFGTILVIMEDPKTGERFDVEVTTFRKEEDYYGGRWPGKVEFTSEIIEDLSRRDFTINAMAINLARIFEPSIGAEEIVNDPFGGITALKSKMVRAVGNPHERFEEDGLRAFKACRLAAELDFTVDPTTIEAIKASLTVAKKISMERIRDEFLKLLKYAPKPSVGVELMRETGLLEIFMPELLENIGVNQPLFHSDDVYTHSLKCLDLAEDSIKMAALLHDIGKARTKTEDDKGTHFYGHDRKSAEIAEEIMTRLKFSKAEIKRVSALIRWHMFYYPSADWRKVNEFEPDAVFGSEGGWTDSAIRRFIKNVGEDLIDDLFKLRIADAGSNPKSLFNPIEIDALEKRIAEVRAQDMALKITDLDIDGHDLAEIGIQKGPQMGEILNQLLEKVIEQPELNEKSKLLNLAKSFIS